jgi:tetratricopeptide (TPR) repeat protein
VDEQNATILRTLAEAMKAVPNGPETVRMNLLATIVATANGFLPGDPDQHEQRIAQAAGHLATVFTPEIDPALASEAADLLAAATPDGVPRAVTLLEQYVERHPQRLNLRQSLGMLHLMAGNLEDAERCAKLVMDAETLPTSVLSQLQPELRKMAGVLLMDVEGRRFSAATNDAERATRLAAMETGRNRLAELVIDKQNDTQLMRADARLAYLVRDFAKAAQLYDRLVRDTNLCYDTETLYYCAIALENVNQNGLARERLIQGLQINPPCAMRREAPAELRIARRASGAARALRCRSATPTARPSSTSKPARARRCAMRFGEPASPPPARRARAAARARRCRNAARIRRRSWRWTPA